MSQQSVCKLLEKQPDKWFSSKEIAVLIKINKEVVCVNLSKLYKQGYVFRKETKGVGRTAYLWRIV